MPSLATALSVGNEALPRAMGVLYAQQNAGVRVQLG